MGGGIGFFGSVMEVPGDVSISSGIARVTFADGVVFDFKTSLSDDAVSSDSWHMYSVRAEVTKRHTQARIGAVLVLNDYQLIDVWEALKDYPALEFIGTPWRGDLDTLIDIDEYGDPVRTGAKTVVDGFGSVTHIVDDKKRILINRTTPDHTLHEGYVARHVYDDGNPNFYSLQSIGFGTGALAGPNSFFSPLTWDHLTSEVIEAFASRKYTDRTGKDSSKVYLANPWSFVGVYIP